MKLNEIKELALNELLVRIQELRKEIFQLRLQQQAGQLEKPHLLKTLRREIAQLKTILTQKTIKTPSKAH